MIRHERTERLRACRTDATSTREVVSFHRHSELAGVEIRSLKHSARTFHCYSTELQFFAPLTWRGELWHRRQEVVMEAGTVLCAHPGEVYFSRRILTPGAAIFLAIDSSVFHEHLSKRALHASELQLRAFAAMSKRLEAKFLRVSRLVRSGPTTLEAQTATVELIEGMLAELLEESPDEASSVAAALRNAERVRERVHGDALATVELSTPVKDGKMSRFRVLRRFKLRYGLPPHTYQLSVRLALAQKALREGQQPAHVAAEYGFFDQSHLTRHFKRFLGVTPAQYARVGARARSSGVTDAVAC